MWNRNNNDADQSLSLFNHPKFRFANHTQTQLEHIEQIKAELDQCIDCKWAKYHPLFHIEEWRHMTKNVLIALGVITDANEYKINKYYGSSHGRLEISN